MPEWSSGFPYFLQLQAKFGNEEFLIWATVSSWSCFCWLYRASPSLDAKNIINLISVLTIWWCPCRVFSCVVGRGCLLWPVRSLGKTLSALCPASFCTPSPNWPVTLVKCFLTSYFCIPVPYNEKDIFFGVSSRRSCKSSSNHSTSPSSALLLGA